MPEAVTGDAPGAPKRPVQPGLGAVVKKRWRAWLRAFHRDLGYLTVGLTIIYAISGLAINHIGQGSGTWDPNFKTFHHERHIAKIPADVPDDVAIARARQALGGGVPSEAVRYGDEIHFGSGGHTVVVYGDSGLVVEDGRSPRFFLRVANWLHEVRGKKAWMYIADLYACILLYLAISGLFMIKGRLGLRWRGAILVAMGAAVPAGYVILSGGPGAHGDKVAAAPAVTPVGGDGSGAAGAPDTPDTPDTPPAADDGDGPAARPPVRMQPREPVERMQPRTPRPDDGDGPPARPPVRMQPRTPAPAPSGD